MRSEHRGTSSIKLAVLKSVLYILIEKFGIQIINDKIAEIFYEKAEEKHDYFYDDLSEAYDNINKNLFAFRNVKK